MKETFEAGRKVYHVANPEVAGIIVPRNEDEDGIHQLAENYIDVVFVKPVGFSGNPRRVDKCWKCNIDLLYSSSWAAKVNDKEK